MVLSFKEIQFSLVNIENYWTIFLIWIFNADSNIFKTLKISEKMKIYSHGCLIDFPDWLSAKNPMSHTKAKAREVKPKKIST